MHTQARRAKVSGRLALKQIVIVGLRFARNYAYDSIPRVGVANRARSQILYGQSKCVEPKSNAVAALESKKFSGAQESDEQDCFTARETISILPLPGQYAP